jgi:hypothetical protein
MGARARIVALSFVKRLPMELIWTWLGSMFGHWQNWLSGGGLGGFVLLVLVLLERYHPRGWTVPKRYHFLLVAAFFVLGASFMTWKDQYELATQRQQELDRLAKPEFTVIFAQFEDAYSSDLKSTVVMLELGIMNSGSDSAATNWNVHYRSKTLDQDVPLVAFPSSEEKRAFPDEDQMFDLDVPDFRLRGLSPIVRGSIVAGKLFVEVPGNRQAELNNGAVITVSVEDYLGNSFKTDTTENKRYAGNLPFHRKAGGLRIQK